jgi:S-formylglutathione hydrolase
VSALAPVAAPMRAPWGKKAFGNYLGPDEATWRAYDASVLVADHRHPGTLLVDQGLADKFLVEQLYTETFLEACKAAGQKARVRTHEGYDHSYFFISTFMGDHMRHHAEALGAVAEARV